MTGCCSLSAIPPQSRALTALPAAWFLLITMLPAAAVHAGEAKAADRPNIVFILADDLGWRDLSVEGSTFYETPNIDRIAGAGMRFLQGYASCQVCSPSRASIMTGRTPARHGITDWIGAAEESRWRRNTRKLPPKYVHQLPADDTSLAEALRAGGYRTFYAGKWHLGGEGSFPEDHGFEINRGGHHRGSPPGGFFSPYNNPKLSDGPAGESLPLRLGRETAQFISQHADQPFFACLAFYSVHAPIQSTESLWAKYREKAAAQPTPPHRFLIDRTSPVRQVQDHPVYAGMVEAMDDAVGLVLAELEKQGLTENTILVFTSDNGGVSAGDGKATSNLPLRGGKGRQWEGGLRVPYHIAWPGVIEPGSTCRVPVTGSDFYPTLLEMAGLPLMPKQHVDGVSLVPLLKGGTISQRQLHWHYPHYGNQGGEPSAVLRDGDWKLIHYYEDGRDELYQLANDPGEQDDVAPKHPEKVRQLRGQLDAWLAETGAIRPLPNPKFSEEAWERQQEQTRTKTLPALERQAAAFLEGDYHPGNNWWGSTRD